MSSPSFPPVLLDKCLDFAKHLTQLKTGRATIEVNLNQSRFYFSTDNSFYSPPGYAGRYKRRITAKKKSPSDLRRDAKRREKFLEKKQEPSPSAASPTVPPTTADQKNLSWISDTPMTKEDDNSMKMDAEPSDSSRNASGETISEKENVKKNEVKKISNPIPQMISQINSPAKSKETETEEVRIMICAPDQTSAANVFKQLPKSSYMGPAKSKRHFVFSTQLTPSQVLKIKDDNNQILKQC